jgi:hypothetical protein
MDQERNSWRTNAAIRVCAIAVLFPALKPLAQPAARYLLRR